MWCRRSSRQATSRSRCASRSSPSLALPGRRAGDDAPGSGAGAGLTYTSLEVLGRGRSGVVYRGRTADGRELACKVFDSRGLTRLVQWFFLGSPNPYVWSEDAARCAHLRRELLRCLVPYWTRGRVRVAGSVGACWNDEHRAMELQTEYVPGRALALAHPLREDPDGELRELRRELLPLLHRRLREAGFAGMLWQAGYGNPVALNNFLVEEDGRFAWIDLESGVPALFSPSPRRWLGYAAWSLRRGRALFDDVEPRRLEGWLREHADTLTRDLGAEACDDLAAKSAELADAQRRWKSMPRHERGVRCAWITGRLDEAEARRLLRRPLEWYAREAVGLSASALRLAASVPGRLLRELRRARFTDVARIGGRFLTSGRYRRRLARAYLRRRVRAWRVRGQLSFEHGRRLKQEIARKDSASYVTDFGVHVAIKPLVKSLEWWLAPALFAAGLLSEAALAWIIVSGGSVARTLYTLNRVVQATAHGRERPWIALAVGVLPVVGNFAFPLQILYSSRDREEILARFILNDGCARIGAHIPIWGGQDTLTEHRWNRLPDRLPRVRRLRQETRQGAPPIPRL